MPDLYAPTERKHGERDAQQHGTNLSRKQDLAPRPAIGYYPADGSEHKDRNLSRKGNQTEQCGRTSEAVYEPCLGD